MTTATRVMTSDFLRQLHGFDTLEPEVIEQIVDLFERLSFSPGQYLMRRGQSGDVMHLIQSGQVQVIRDGCDTLADDILLAEGAVVGEMALLTGALRRADVRAKTQVSTLALNGRHLIPLLRKHSALAHVLTALLVHRIEESEGFRQVGNYRMLQQLGEGSTSRVYEGVHLGSDRPVAIKMLNHALVYERKFLERFQTEAEIIASLDHPSIVRIFDTEEKYGTYFIIMERLVGEDLRTVWKREKRFSPAKTKEILCSVAAALSYAHAQGVLHRDVKLANCVMAPDGTIKLTDFGLSRFRKNHSRRAGIEGSPDFLAPEMILHQRGDERTDIYALGVMAFTLLTGVPPFPAKTVREVLIAHVRQPVPDLAAWVPDIPDDLRMFVEGALKKDPAQRLAAWPEIMELLC